MADRKSIEKALMKASGPEEIKRILEEAGESVSDEKASEIFSSFSVSPEELAQMNGGGAYRDYCKSVLVRSKSEYGCAATVEDGSDCWRVDGGCSVCNIIYT